MKRLARTLLLAVLVTFGAALFLGQTKSNPVRDEISAVIVVTQSRFHLGEGAIVSSDGRYVAYVGDDNGLHILDVDSQQSRTLLTQVAPGIDVFSHPTFDPTGTRVVFSASGGTKYYPSDIYSVNIDGTGLRKLTTSRPSGPDDGGFGEYYYAPAYSPDGTRILIWQYESATQRDSLAVMSADGSDFRVVSYGRPLFWNLDGTTAFVANRDGVGMVTIDTGASSPIRGIEGGAALGLLPGGDILVVADSGISRVRVEDSAASVVSQLALQLSQGHTSGAPAILDTNGAKLLEGDLALKGEYVLLRFDKGDSEILAIGTVNGRVR